jgi:hypothetical protein
MFVEWGLLQKTMNLPAFIVQSTQIIERVCRTGLRPKTFHQSHFVLVQTWGKTFLSQEVILIIEATEIQSGF